MYPIKSTGILTFSIRKQVMEVTKSKEFSLKLIQFKIGPPF
jgi:hypothetical protein